MASKRPTIPYMDYVAILVHRVLAGHKPYEECADCPFVVCRHCDDFGPPGDDHTCPCPNGDDCAEHPRRAP